MASRVFQLDMLAWADRCIWQRMLAGPSTAAVLVSQLLAPIGCGPYAYSSIVRRHSKPHETRGRPALYKLVGHPRSGVEDGATKRPLCAGFASPRVRVRWQCPMLSEGMPGSCCAPSDGMLGLLSIGKTCIRAARHGFPPGRLELAPGKSQSGQERAPIFSRPLVSRRPVRCG